MVALFGDYLAYLLLIFIGYSVQKIFFAVVVLFRDYLIDFLEAMECSIRKILSDEIDLASEYLMNWLEVSKGYSVEKISVVAALSRGYLAG